MMKADTGSESPKVIQMERFRSGKSLSPINQLEAYWTALRDGDDVPKRSQIDPRGLEAVLKFAFILERIAPGIARFRLAGQHLSELTGQEVRGMPLTVFFSAASRNHIGATLEHVFDVPSVAELTLRSEPRLGRVGLEARMILLPLRSDFGDINRALGMLIADGPDGHVPYRFDVSGTLLRPVTGQPARAEVPVPDPRPAAGFAEAPDGFAGRAPHLRLVKSDD